METQTISENASEFNTSVTGCAHLPELERVILAKCKRTNGAIEYHKIRRIQSRETKSGWHWSGADIKSYFTLEVLSWEPFKFNRDLIAKMLDTPSQYISLMQLLSNDQKEIVNTAANLKITR